MFMYTGHCIFFHKLYSWQKNTHRDGVLNNILLEKKDNKGCLILKVILNSKQRTYSKLLDRADETLRASFDLFNEVI